MSSHVSQFCRSFLETLPKGFYPDSAIPLKNALTSGDDSPLCDQSLMPLENREDCLEVCDVKDVAIAVLEGEGRLSLQGEEVFLGPGKFVFIPANTPHRLQSTSNLILFLSRYEANSSVEDTAWIFDL